MLFEEVSSNRIKILKYCEKKCSFYSISNITFIMYNEFEILYF